MTYNAFGGTLNLIQQVHSLRSSIITFIQQVIVIV